MNPPLADWEQSIQRLQRLSGEMLELAQAGEWEAVMDREQQRRMVLDDLFRQPAPAAIAPLLENASRAVLASDAQLTEMAHVEMDRLSDNIKLIQQGRRALRAYPDL
ncbi:MAG: flagellar protein FliT [Candidatus Competibacteraceae bacterium]|nr:flagellar protein FliT [Candidatus Competibacteraceae bacterium]